MSSQFQREGIRAIMQAHLTRGRELGKLVRALPTGYAREHALQAFRTHRDLGKQLVRKHIVARLPGASDFTETQVALITEYAHGIMVLRHAPNSNLNIEPFGKPQTTAEFASDEQGNLEPIDSNILKAADLAVSSMLNESVEVF